VEPGHKALHWDAQLCSLCRPQNVFVASVLELRVTCNDIKQENILHLIKHDKEYDYSKK
jgi:hypothetical protein